MISFKITTPLLEWQWLGIYCPKCTRTLYRITRMVDENDICRAEDIEPVRKDIPAIHNGDLMICPFDRYEWFDDPEDLRTIRCRN